MIKPAFLDTFDATPHRLWNFAESYFCLRGFSEKLGFKQYTVVSTSPSTLYVKQLSNRKTDLKQWFVTVLKVVSLATVIFPLLLLFVKAYFRRKYIFELKVDSNVPPPLSISLPGGFANPGHSCFISAALHCFKALPNFSYYLDETRHPLSQNPGETLELFQKRQQVRQQVAILCKQSENGKIAESQKLAALHQALPAFTPFISATEGGDPSAVWDTLYKILELPLVHVKPTVGRPGHTNRLLIFLRPDSSFQQKAENDYDFIVAPNALAFTARQIHGNNSVVFDPPLSLQLKSQGTPVPYRLSAAGVLANGHALALIKNEAGWIRCDDAYIAPISEIDPSLKTGHFLLIYTKL